MVFILPFAMCCINSSHFERSMRRHFDLAQ
jgi:hypothetical protein